MTSGALAASGHSKGDALEADRATKGDRDLEARSLVEDCLVKMIALADEKTGIAQNLFSLVTNHVRKLEDEVCAFEREVQVARASGLLSAEEAADINRLLARDHQDDLSDESLMLANQEGGVATDASDAGSKTDSQLDTGADSKLKMRATPEIHVKSDSESNSKSNSSSKVKRSPPPKGIETTRKRSRDGSGSGSGSSSETKSGSLDLRSTGNNEPKSPVSKANQKVSSASGERTYCVCGEESFGDMIGCDNRDCLVEWFHYACVGLSAPPSGKWYCSDCAARLAKRGGHL